MRRSVDESLAAVAASLAAWLARHVDESRTEWTSAFAAELGDIDGGWAKLKWAVAGLTLLWSFRPQRRRARTWQLVGGPRSLARRAYERRSEGLALATTLSLVALVLFVVGTVVPWFQNAADWYGLTLPLPYHAARRLLQLLEHPAVPGLVLLAALIKLRSNRTRAAGPMRMMRALPVVNFLAVLLLVALTTAFIEMAVAIPTGIVAREKRHAHLRSFEDALIRSIDPANAPR